MAGFSRLAPRTHVKPHVGWAASVYRLHLALDVPPGCRLRVAAETRSWQEGRCLIFDDTAEHEAWNDSALPRGVLLLDFLRPGFSGSVADHVPEEVQQYAARLFSAKAGGADPAEPMPPVSGDAEP
jgi:beta-hydroxylase